jgi:dTDP-4-dehydrorhamnose 3,5-epimerase-like enzyme
MGFAHGYLTLEYDNVVMYKVTDYFAPMHDSGIRWDDPDVAVSMAGQGGGHRHFGQGPATSAP